MQKWEEIWKLHGENLPWVVNSHQPSLKKYTNLLNATNILEIGCGDGFNSFWLQQQGYNVTSIDVSKRAVEIAKNKFPNLKNIFAIDIFSYQTSEKYDFIFDRGCLHGFDSIEMVRFVNKVYELLSPNGHWLNISGKICSQLGGPPQKSLTTLAEIIEKRLEIISVNTVELLSQPNNIFPAWEILSKKC